MITNLSSKKFSVGEVTIAPTRPQPQIVGPTTDIAYEPVGGPAIEVWAYLPNKERVEIPVTRVKSKAIGDPAPEVIGLPDPENYSIVLVDLPVAEAVYRDEAPTFRDGDDVYAVNEDGSGLIQFMPSKIRSTKNLISYSM